MNFEQKLGAAKVAIDRELEHHFNIAISDAEKKDVLLGEALKYTKEIALAGGKRIRGALLMQAYFGFGGKEKAKILKVAVAIELVHLFLLVHDDVIDHGDLRHGKETLHKMLEKKYQKTSKVSVVKHFGESIAIIVGDFLFAMANGIILEAGFSNKETLQVLLQLQKIVANTIVGQSQDINIEYAKNANKEDVLAMYENKTAKYTFEGPLHLGAILAGVESKKSLCLLSEFSLPLGIAFQIQDDILGVFGSEKKLGKSVASDIEEGKQSLLVVDAMSSCSAAERKKINGILGKKNLKKDEIVSFQNILKSTGALLQAQQQCNAYLQEGSDKLEKIIILPEVKKFLFGMIEYLEKREV